MFWKIQIMDLIQGYIGVCNLKCRISMLNLISFCFGRICFIVTIGETERQRGRDK